MGFRAKPPGVVDGPIGHGTLYLPGACARARALAARPFKFTLTGPHMLAKTLHDRHYRDPAALALAIAGVLAEQVARLDADVVQVDEANLPGHPDEWPWALEAINTVLDAVRGTPAVHLCFGNYGGQSIQRGTWAKLIDYLNGLHADHQPSRRRLPRHPPVSPTGRSDPRHLRVTVKWVQPVVRMRPLMVAPPSIRPSRLWLWKPSGRSIQRPLRSSRPPPAAS